MYLGHYLYLGIHRVLYEPPVWNAKYPVEINRAPEHAVESPWALGWVQKAQVNVLNQR